MGIDKTIEVFDDLGNMAVAGVAIVKSGGKIWKSLPRLMEILGAVRELISDVPGALPELRDIDAAESGKLAEAGYNLARRVINAVKE